MRRGQAALEYLITYGWGFIILIVVIGALAYLGFLNPSRYIPSRCELGSQLECVDYKLEEAQAGVGGNNGKISLKLRNNFGDDIRITKIETTDKAMIISPAIVKIPKGTTSDIIIAQIDVSDATILAKDDRTSIPLIITFQRDKDGSPVHTLTGEIFATVQ